MEPRFSLLPEQASTLAARVDNLYFFITAVCTFFAVAVTALVILFAIKYRRRHPDEIGEPIHGSLALEMIWSGIPFILAMVMFVWGASVYFAIARVPEEAMDIYAVAWLVADCAATLAERDPTVWDAVFRFAAHPTVTQFVPLAARYTALKDMAERLPGVRFVAPAK